MKELACRRQMESCWMRMKACLMMESCHKRRMLACRRHWSSCHIHWASCHTRMCLFSGPCPLTLTCPSWRTVLLARSFLGMSSGTGPSSCFCPQAWRSWRYPPPFLFHLRVLHARLAHLGLRDLHDLRILRRDLRACQSPGIPAPPFSSAP